MRVMSEMLGKRRAGYGEALAGGTATIAVVIREPHRYSMPFLAARKNRHHEKRKTLAVVCAPIAQVVQEGSLRPLPPPPHRLRRPYKSHVFYCTAFSAGNETNPIGRKERL